MPYASTLLCDPVGQDPSQHDDRTTPTKCISPFYMYYGLLMTYNVICYLWVINKNDIYLLTSGEVCDTVVCFDKLIVVSFIHGVGVNVLFEK